MHACNGVSSSMCHRGLGRGVTCTALPSHTHGESTSQPARLKSSPRVSYSIRRGDVKAQEAAELLWTSWTHVDPPGSSVSPATNQFAYWQAPPSEGDVEKMSRALDGSLAVVAAFAHVDLSRTTGQQGGDLAAGVAQQPITGPWPLQQDAKTLVGLGRATGDAALTAQLYDLAVHPSVRGFGVGRQVVRLLVRQLQSRGIYDVGTVCPAEAESFFRLCRFADDPEQSTFMAYPRGGAAATGAGSDAAGQRTAAQESPTRSLPQTSGHARSSPQAMQLLPEDLQRASGALLGAGGWGGESLQLLLRAKLDLAIAEAGGGPVEGSTPGVATQRQAASMHYDI
ncbi:hypothetical protein FOA52_004918 [Chlamydomonas sp. UWO 241]|nr:hypothetical protein FOA52_004918 [Chlamydomonas sp. UWO 241]